jgi:hypothetical protein
MRWGRVSVAGIVLAAGGIVGWRAWPHDELCDVPKPVSAPSGRLPAAAPAARFDPPKPPPNAAYPLLYNAVHFPGGPQLGRLRWALRTSSLPDSALEVRADERVVIATVLPDLAAYRLSDGKLLWRLHDARLENTPDLRGDTVMVDRTRFPSGKTTHESADSEPGPRWAKVGLDVRTGKVRWCLHERDFLDRRFYQPDTPPRPHDRLVVEEDRRAALIDPDTGRTMAHASLPARRGRDGGGSREMYVGWGKLVVRFGNALWVYRLADGRLIYHISELPHPVPKKGQAVQVPEMDKVILGPGRVLAESMVSEPDLYRGRYLATAFDDAGKVAWQRPGAGHESLPYEPSVFGDAVILRNEESETHEARRLSDGTLIWRRPFGLEWSTSTVGPAYLYKVTRLQATAVSRATGKATTLPLVGADSLGDHVIQGHPNALITHDKYTVAVFDLPG